MERRTRQLRIFGSGLVESIDHFRRASGGTKPQIQRIEFVQFVAYSYGLARQETDGLVANHGTEWELPHGVVAARQPHCMVWNAVPVKFIDSLLGEIRQEGRVV